MALLGLTVKEDVPDLRNTKVVDIVQELSDYGVRVVCSDPLADSDEASAYYGIDLVPLESISEMDAVVLAVMHRKYKELGLERIAGLCQKNQPVLVDVKSAFDPGEAERLGIAYWRL